jgi:hypothetical protein
VPRNASAAAVVVALAWLAAGPAVAQALYKWIDTEGRVQYSDKAPKGFKGEVTRIETETDRVTLPAVAAPPAPPMPPATAPEKAKAAADGSIAAKRRATRELLGARLKEARAKVEAAKKAMEASESPEPEERQIVQQRGAQVAVESIALRSNCRVEVGEDGKRGVMCAAAVPKPEYYDRVARQQADLRKAEEELAAAEEAWRRGVD